MDQALKILLELTHNPLVLMVLGALLVRARDQGVAALRADANKKLSDKNPANDAEARFEHSAADALEKIAIPLSPKR